MTLAEILAVIKAKAGEIDFGVDIPAALTKLVGDSVEALNTKNGELLGKLKDATEKLKAIPEDFSLESWDKMKKDLKDVDTSKLNSDDAVAAVKKQLEEAHAAELKIFQTNIDGLTGDLETQLVDNAVSSALTAANGNSTLLLPHVKQQVKMVKGEDGKYGAIVVDAKGVERFSMTKAGERMGVDELVGEFKVNDTYKSAFTNGNSGGGAGGSGGKGGGDNPFVKGKDFNLTEQSKMANADPALAKQMQEAAATINNAAA